jgi:hypothetical protein
MAHDGNTAVFAGILCLVAGVAVIGALIMENWKIRWRFWDADEKRGMWLGGIATVIGVVFLCCGCGGSQPEPIDPVTVEVEGPAAEFESTMNLYIFLSLARMELANCEAARASPEEGSVIRDVALQERQLLRDEFEAYVHGGQGGLYCGPVCEEMKSFLEDADVSICEE